MTALFYLLEANLYLAILYGFYRLLLHRETFHQLNRWCLMAIILVSFSTPLLKVEKPAAVEHKVAEATKMPLQIQKESSRTGGDHKSITAHLSSEPKPGDQTRTSDLTALIPLIYFSITVIFLVYIFAGILQIIKLYRISPKFRQDGVTYILINKNREAFSFINWLFYSRDIPRDSAIVAHELVHIRQKHSLDLLFFDLAHALSWFNPFLYLMRRDLKLTHEFIADQQASLSAGNQYEYARLLIDYADHNTDYSMTHQMFNTTQLKQRIFRLGSDRSLRIAQLKYLLALPLLVLITGFSAFNVSKEYGFLNISVGLNNTSALIITPHGDIKIFNLPHSNSTSRLQPSAASAALKNPSVAVVNDASSEFVLRRDTVPIKKLSAEEADSLRNKYWAPKEIRDSVEKYEWAVKLLSDSMRNDAGRATAILKGLQKERDDLYRRKQDSVKQKLITDRSTWFSDDKILAYPQKKDRLEEVDQIVLRIESAFSEARRLTKAINGFRAQVSGDEFPMLVNKMDIRLDYYLSFEEVKIPHPTGFFGGKWVQNENERLAFYSQRD